MKSYLKIAAVAAAGFAAVSPAWAAEIIQGKPYQQVGDIAQNQVHNAGGDQDSTRINAFLKDTPEIGFFFESASNLESDGAGHATVTGDGGDAGFNEITLSIEEGFAFTALEVNLDGTNSDEPFEAMVSFSVLGSTEFTNLGTVSIGSGSNFSLINSEGELFDAVRFTAPTNKTFNLIRQVDVNAQQVAAVPEPATWAMFLMGFGAVGYSMRSRKTTYRLAQAV
jgi:hypothetical protein